MSEGGGEQGTEPPEQRELGSVPDPVAVRIRAKRDVQPEHCSELNQGRVRNALYDSTFNPADVRVRQANEGSDLGLRQPGGESGFTEFLADPSEGLVDLSGCPVQAALAGGHGIEDAR